MNDLWLISKFWEAVLLYIFIWLPHVFDLQQPILSID